MKKIGTLTPIWNQELFLKPHFDMLMNADLYRHVVLMQKFPLPNYYREHGYSRRKDRSEEILNDMFPRVEIYESNFPPNTEFSAPLYNEGLQMMQECDIVLRLDPDMLWTQKDFNRFIDYIQETDFDSYRMDFPNDSINYYVTGRFDLGLHDAQETDALGVNPKYMFSGVLDYSGKKPTNIVKLDNWVCHHFRGWQKPKSTPPDWAERIVTKEYIQKYGNNGKFFECPKEIRIIMEDWMEELKDYKSFYETF